MDRIDDIQVLIDQFSGCGPDKLNYIVVTEATAFGADENEVTEIDLAAQIQFEGYLLQPRHLLSQPFEVYVNKDDEAAEDKVDFMLNLINESSVIQAGRQGLAHQFSNAYPKRRAFASALVNA